MISPRGMGCDAPEHRVLFLGAPEPREWPAREWSLRAELLPRKEKSET